jgi:type I restriction enzyme S subunit
VTNKAYPEYKESGVEWLGSVPKSWPIGRIKNSVVLAKNGVWGDEPTGNNDDIWCVRVADFDRPNLSVSDSERTIRSVPASDRLGRELQRGNLLLEKSGGGEKSPVGFVALFDHSDNAVCSNFVARVELCKDMVPRYWTYLHATTYAVRLTQRSIKQTSGIQNLDQSSYFNELTVFPPHAEQRQIADYLDAQTANIDALIAKQERLIETLAERRQAVISHAVTKGLDPDSPMKDSGQEWLGEVPSSWQVGTLKRTWRVIDCKHVTADFVEDGIPLASIRETQAKWVDLGAAKQTTEAFYLQLIEGDRKPRARDLIFTRNATVGAVAQVPPDASRFAVGQDVCILRPLSGATSSDYQQYLLESWVISSQIESLLLGSTFKRINVEQIRDFVLPVPGETEQREIAEYLDRETSQIDALSAKAREMIDVLKERRQALISAAVTGKIDVRGLA